MLSSKAESVEREAERSVICMKVVVKGEEEMRVLRVVYKIKSRGPISEPW